MPLALPTGLRTVAPSACYACLLREFDMADPQIQLVSDAVWG